MKNDFVKTCCLEQKLGEKQMRITLRESLNQSDKFSKEHVRFDGKLDVFEQNGVDTRSMFFSYQCNPKYCEPTFTGIFDALLLDASSYENCETVGMFCKEYGYDDVDQAIECYEACKKTASDLRKLFDPDELDYFYELSQNEWEELENFEEEKE